MANLRLVKPTLADQTTARYALDSFLLDAQARNLTAKTIRYYTYEIGRFITWAEDAGTVSTSAITPDILRRYLVTLRDRGLRASSQRTCFRALRAFFNWCVAEGTLRTSPLVHVQLPRDERRILPALTTHEVQALLAACLSTRDTAIVLCLLDTGCRASEFVALNVGDVDMATGAVRVRHGKGNKERISYVGPKARLALRRSLAARMYSSATTPLWLSDHGLGRLTLGGLQALFKRLEARSGVNVSPHALRRTCALWCFRAGWRLNEIQRLLGHADLSILRQYLDLSDDDVQAAHLAKPPTALLA